MRKKRSGKYKLRKLFFGRVIIFSGSGTRIKKAAAVVLAAAVLTFAAGIVGTGYNVYLNGAYIGCAATRAEAVNAEKNAGISQGSVNLFPRFALRSQKDTADSLECNLRIASGQTSRGVMVSLGGEKLFALSSYQAFLETVYSYADKYKTENTVLLHLDDRVSVAEGVFPASAFMLPCDAADKLRLLKIPVITNEEITLCEQIPFKTRGEKNTDAPSGTIISEGADGVKNVTYFVSKTNGAETQRYVISENVVSEPVDRIVSENGSLNFKIPVNGAVSSVFGQRWGKNHDGIDIAANMGDKVHAAESGTVIFCGEAGGYGKLIIIEHKNGFKTYYGHLSVTLAATGVFAAQGTVIGEVGSTGNSTGPHLHFEIRKNDVPCDPSQYFTK